MGIEEAITSYIRETAHKIGLEEGIEKGIEKGIEEGIEKGKTTNALNAIPKLYSIGVSIENIAISLDVSIDFVKQALVEMSEKN